MIGQCGCVVLPDTANGVLRSISKCVFHSLRRRSPASLDEGYYRMLANGPLTPGSNHANEIVDALGPLPIGSGNALEIGAGTSRYVNLIRDAGYAYTGLDPSQWAADWTAKTYGVSMRHGFFEDLDFKGHKYSFVLAAHVLEHTVDPALFITKVRDILIDRGELWIVVPDDRDLWNPDHLWFFTKESLGRVVKASGLTVVNTAVRSIVPHEDFIFMSARKQ